MNSRLRRQSDEVITAWITKRVLITGLVEVVKGTVCHNISSNMISYGRMNSAHGNDWHRTSVAAMARAEEMRLNKIAALKKQLEKLERMVFK